MAIEDRPVRLRVAAPRGYTGKIDREGGDFGAGLIAGFSAITEGEALGHSLWIDREFLNQTAVAGNAAPNGVKMRFTHPGLSGDGLGTAIGKAKNFRVKGGQVYADAHLLASAHESPNGDLAGYTMSLAEESPDLFGASIVFNPDRSAEDEYSVKNSDKEGRFISPDKKNRANLRHARLLSLNQTDLVDDPAANPQGMFSAGFLSGGELAARAESLLAFAFGLTDETPDEMSAGPHPERAKVFLQGFLERHGLLILPEQSVRQGKDQIFTESTADDSALRALGERVTALEHKLRAHILTEVKANEGK